MIPQVAIVGRPNVGKSTLLNRLARRRISIVDDRPGVTRDRIAVELDLDGKVLEVVDTGGIGIVDEQDLEVDIHDQIATAIATSQVILMIVDGQQGVHPLDQEVAERLRPLDVPVILIANKCESDSARNDTAEFYSLGLGEPVAVSAAHGQGVNELIESLLGALPEGDAKRSMDPALKIAIVGRRNAGKSTFINALIEEERVIVSEIPGTTRDAVDVRFIKDGIPFVAIDTAGLLRRAKLRGDVEFYAQSRSIEAIRRADVVLFVVDAAHGISQLDKRIAHEVCIRHRPCVIAVNKWDLVKEGTTTEGYEEYLSQQLPGLSFAPCAFITARDGKNVASCTSLVQSLAKQAQRRVGTGQLNRAIEAIRTGPRPRVRHGKEPKLYFGTQVGVLPPTIVLFVNKPGWFSPQYRRFIENRFRELLDYPEVPLKIFYRNRDGSKGGK